MKACHDSQDGGSWLIQRIGMMTSLTTTGPACYELGVGHSRSRVRPTYVGETKSESARISSYGAGHSHLSKTIDSYLRRGFNLYYRGMAVSSKAEAKAMQDNYLSEYDYEWNTQGQGEDA